MRETILVIEEDLDLARLFESILEVEGYNSFAARSLDEARQQLTRCEPDLIVYDWTISNQNGYEFFKELHASAHHSHIPLFVVCDTSPTRATLEMLASLGVALIEKPFDLIHFCHYVANLVGGRERAVGA